MRQTSLRLLPLCLAISGAVRAQEAAQPTWNLCVSPNTIPLFTDLMTAPVERQSAATDISANTLDVKSGEVTVFSGDVKLVHADQWMSTDKVTYSHESEQFVTEGQVRYQDRAIRLTAEAASGDQKADTLKMEKVHYQFNEELGNGTAATAVMKGPIGSLTRATYSTCPPGQRQWEFSAGRISVNDKTATGVAHNVSLRLGGVPVLWLPVISFPTDDKRRSGLLAPTLGRDDINGLDLRVPIYWNIAPNYDATFTPRWLSKRGLMHQGEFRYLTERSQGQFNGTWLPNDDLTGTSRSLLNWRSNTRINRHWYTSANLNDVSDVNYFSDFGDSIDATSISLLASNAGVYGRGKYWSASLIAETWQIASPLVIEGNEPYRRLPRLQFSAQRPFARWFEAGVGFEAVRFSHDSFDAGNPAWVRRYDGGNRVDVLPYVRLPFSGNSWFITPQLGWRYTDYSSLEGPPVDNGGASSVSRSVPIASLDAGIYFERSMNWGGQDYVQTLEPRMYYLRVPYRDQSELPLFDTGQLTFSWSSLLRDNRFGGADRQADANQVALALTTRILSSADGRERLRAGIGRITYFDQPRVGLLTSLPDASVSGSAWIGTLDMAMNEWWSMGVTQQWDPDQQRTELSSVRGQLHLNQGTIVNAAYRYRRGTPGQPTLEETDLSFAIPVGSSWNLYGRWNYSLHDNQTIEALAGFEWDSCCMAVRIVGRQFIRSFNSQENLGLYLEIELKGLGSFGRDTGRLLDNAILGYTR